MLHDLLLSLLCVQENGTEEVKIYIKGISCVLILDTFYFYRMGYIP